MIGMSQVKLDVDENKMTKLAQQLLTYKKTNKQTNKQKNKQTKTKTNTKQNSSLFKVNI